MFVNKSPTQLFYHHEQSEKQKRKYNEHKKFTRTDDLVGYVMTAIVPTS